ncbi:hypothetical protein Cgig2_028258 [Carnegiea gigantea]|uniref:NADH-quinone oxidoreductase subunit D domain-containing protein n=1 Tax=Carnegiea gigantea TaxID=171969 RepID=A0A9Q1JFJ4_9CARY|nr:hypothetical protein Cgig2_028258 [Carnegiea gigantea]
MNWGKTYDCTNYKKRLHDSQYGSSPPIHAWHSPTHPTMFTKAITVNGPEQLGNILLPKGASYIRVIMLELSCDASHLLWLGPFMEAISTQTHFFYIFRERELVYDLFKAATSMRMMHNYFRIGVGIIGGEEAINWGLSGPMLRAFGIQWDPRKSKAISFELSKQELYMRVEARIGKIFDRRSELESLKKVYKTIWMLVPIFIRILGITIGVRLIVWLERETFAGIQQCIRPEYTGPLGILQADADRIKLLLKETLLP